jgi:hypothetical protein
MSPSSSRKFCLFSRYLSVSKLQFESFLFTWSRFIFLKVSRYAKQVGCDKRFQRRKLKTIFSYVGFERQVRRYGEVENLAIKSILSGDFLRVLGKGGRNR